MNTKQLKRIASLAGLMIGSFALAVMAESFSWTPPTCAAPGCNIPAPINVGGNHQYKEGSIALGGSTASPTGYAFEANGLGYFTGMKIAGSLFTTGLVLEGDNMDKIGYVLTNAGSGRAEWKAKGSSSITLSDVSSFTLQMNRNDGAKSVSTPTTYLFCALTRIESEMSRVDAGGAINNCQVTKNPNGTWSVSGYVGNDPPYKCQMTCFK